MLSQNPMCRSILELTVTAGGTLTSGAVVLTTVAAGATARKLDANTTARKKENTLVSKASQRSSRMQGVSTHRPPRKSRPSMERMASSASRGSSKS
jgi:hypothetical protein